MNFHDPQTREQMEREGWLYDRWLYLNEGRVLGNALIHEDNMDLYFYEKKMIQLSPDGTLSVYDPRTDNFANVPMKSFAAALKAAKAILEGVDG